MQLISALVQKYILESKLKSFRWMSLAEEFQNSLVLTVPCDLSCADTEWKSKEGKNKHKAYSLRRRKEAPENLVLEPTPVLKEMNILKKSLMLME